MAKYIVETYYTCTFKVKHYLDDISNNQLDQLDKRDDQDMAIFWCSAINVRNGFFEIRLLAIDIL